MVDDAITDIDRELREKGIPLRNGASHHAVTDHIASIRASLDSI